MSKNITHKVLNISNIVLIITILISSILIITNSKIKFDFSSNGFNTFLEIFKFPLALSAALLATLTLTYSIERMRQFEQQLIMFSRNNRFNNYFRFNEEFSKYFENQELFSLYKKAFPNNSVFEISNHIQRLYKYYYGAKPRFFTTKILQDELKNINNFLSAIDNNVFNKSDYELTTIEHEVLSNISNSNLEIMKVLIKPLSEKLVAPIYSNRSLSVPSLKEIDKHFLLMNELFLSVSFYESLLIFDGEKVSSYSTLRKNFMNYLEKLGLK